MKKMIMVILNEDGQIFVDGGGIELDSGAGMQEAVGMLRAAENIFLSTLFGDNEPPQKKEKDKE